MSGDLAYCVELVRKRDRDRYWCAMLAPQAQKQHLFTLYAFNSEIAEIGLSVSEPLIGQMRLRWWLDALDPIFEGKPPKHPVAVSLADAVRQAPQTRPLIENLLESRERDMEKTPFADLREAEDYAIRTSGTLTELSVAICGEKNPETLQAARTLGAGWGLLGLIRSVPYQLERGVVLLPLDLCETHNFDRQAFLDHGYKGEPPQGLAECLGSIRHHVADTLTSIGPIRGSAYHPPFLLKVLLTSYLRELDQAGNDPFQLELWRKGPRLRDMLKLKWASITRSA